MKKYLLFLFLTLVFKVVIAQVPTKEREALIAIYNSTNGIMWTNNTNWNTTNPVSSWFGVTVKNINGQDHVTVIDFFSNNLNGNLPNELGDLKELTFLSLVFNDQLTGSIPSVIGNLINLKTLILWDNNFTGNVPIEIGNCTKLEILSLEDNSLTGNIPDSFVNLTLMQSFWLNGNQLSGVIPNIFSNWKDLRYFSIGDAYSSGPDNNFSGTLDFSKNPKMTMYLMAHNDISFLNVRNGNNLNIKESYQFNTTDNPNLTCILVDDPSFSRTNWPHIDATSRFMDTQSECEALSTADITFKQAISIFPNPTRGYLYVSHNEDIKIEHIIVLNSLGQIAHEYQKTNHIDISHLKNGLYFVTLENNHGYRETYKVIKE